MRKFTPVFVISGLSLAAAGLFACGEDEPSGEEIGNFTDGDMSDGDGDGDMTPPDMGDGDMGDGDGDMGDGDGDGDMGDGDGDMGDGDGDMGDGDGDMGDGDGDDDLPAAGCKAWEITYDLTGSKFQISDTPLGLGNQINVVGKPYSADNKIGPGQFVLRFQDVDGAPGNRAFMVSYQMALHFRVKATGANVTTNLDGEVGPAECGVASGALTGTTVAWMPSAIVGYHSRGTILCKGTFCNLADLPKNKPKKIDEITDQPVSDFVFAGDLSSFTMAKTVIEKDSKSTSSWTYLGTEVSRTRIDAPDCLCQ